MAEACRMQKDFFVDFKNWEGVAEILEYLREDGDVMPWEQGNKKLQ